MDSKRLDKKIGELNSRVNGMWLTTKDGPFWRETWALVKEISADFKTVRYPSKQEKDAAWNGFQSIVDTMKEERAKKEEKKAERLSDSAALKYKIISLAKAAWPRDYGFELIVEAATGILFAKMAAYIVEDMVRTLFGMDAVDPREREKRRLIGLSDQMKHAWETFTARKQEMFASDKAECFKVLEAVQTELDKAWEEWKTEGAELNRQREAAFERKRDEKRRLIGEMKSLYHRADEKEAKDEAQALMNEWKQIGFSGKGADDALWQDFKTAMDLFWQARKRGYAQRLEARLANQEAFLEKLEESVRHDEGVLDDKREKLSNVFDGRRADEIRSHLESVIESLEEKIQSKRQKIAEVESDIDELRSKLRDID